MFRWLLLWLTLALFIGCGETPPTDAVGSSQHAVVTTHRLVGIVYAAGTPLPDTMVAALADGTQDVVAEVVTDGQGQFALELAPGVYDLRLTPAPSSGLPPETAPDVVMPNADSRHDVILVASARAVLSGVVRGLGGAPVAGEGIWIADHDSGRAIGSTSTDTDGHYAINLADGSYRLDFSAPWPTPDSVPSNSSYVVSPVRVSGDTTLDIPIPAFVLTGTVTAPDGTPVADARVNLNVWGDDGSGRSWSTSSGAVTSSDGSYRILTLVGSGSFAIAPPPDSNLAPMFVTRDVRPNEPSDFRLGSQPWVLSGTVRGLGGVAVAGEGVWITDHATGRAIGSASTDADGHYAVNLADGSYRLDFSSPWPTPESVPPNSGYVVAALEISSDISLDIELPALLVTGTVTAPDGTPVADARVNLSVWNDDGAGHSWSAQTAAITEPDGSYRILTLSGTGNFDIAAPAGSKLSPMFVTRELQSSEPIDFQLNSQPWLLAGTVRGLGGAPVAAEGIWITDHATGRAIGSASTDADGRYAVNLADGTYRLDFSSPWPTPDSVPQNASYAVAPVQISGDTQLDVQIPVVVVLGAATDSNGVPVPDTRIAVNAWGNAASGDYWSVSSSSTTGPDGRYRILALRGQGSFEIRPPDGSGFAPTFLNGVALEGDFSQSVILNHPDLTPPVIVVAPTVIHLSDTSVSLNWTTNEAASSSVEYGLGAPSGVVFDATLTTRHSITLLGLTPDSIYTYRASSSDASGNGPTTTELLTFRTQPPPGDVTPPRIVSIDVPFASDRSVLISWATDEPASSVVDYGATNALGSVVEGEAGVFGRLHLLRLTGLEPDTRYFARVSSTDPDGNGPTQSELVEFRTLKAPDTTAPIISEAAISGATDTTLTVQWLTDEPASSGVSYNDGTAFEAVNDPVPVTQHTLTLANLRPGTSYRITVASVDVSGNGPTLAAPLDGTTNATPDTHPPALTGLTASPSAGAAVISWQTDAAATSEVHYGLDATRLDGAIADLALDQSHSLMLNGLLAGRTYYFYAVSSDAAGNSGQSPLRSFQTPEPDGDSDGVGDSADNCPGLPNPDQSDPDGDRRGNVCDACPLDPQNDADGDGLCSNVDSCPNQPEDFDGDADSDGCPETSAPACADVTGDGRVDLRDVLNVIARLGARAGSSRYSAACDRDRDGVIDTDDLVAVLNQVGRRC